MVSKLNLEVNRLLKQPQLRQSLIDQGAILESLGGTVLAPASLLQVGGRAVKDSGASID
ncbi:hypothetical protein [Acidovorax sp. SUPP3334]|uniref:hypothetical protein n=1 Tax=Acidovorax sp. SUPP3334 TaxID=2920881 RepID=UPI0023DE2B7E|nr:hypothetical protein [Acidovorax sp. SUPP3334]GKT25874.1 hypothetical protein AVHM3334_19340 [Acidovorax sp. SUPP3334]